MKIIITGSHFTPAQAVVEELQKVPNIEIVYIGRNHTLEGDGTMSVESQILPKMGVRFVPLIAGRLRRNVDFYTLISILKIPIGFFQAFYYLIKEKPDVILSFGGYVGLPVVVVAWFLSIPIILHEQTLVSGLSNFISSFFADKIAVAFDKKYPFPESKIVVTGNPLRGELINSSNSDGEMHDFLSQNQIKKLPLIYITGGNQGSHVINEAVSDTLEDLTKVASVIHQTGNSKFNDFDKLTLLKTKLKNQENYLVKKWVDVSDLSLVLKNAKLAVSRAGANTLLELANFGIPTIVIPLSYLYKDEQNTNAKFFQHIGLCKILRQNELNGKNLFKSIVDILKDYEKFKKSALVAKNLVIPSAAKRLAQETLILGNNSEC